MTDITDAGPRLKSMNDRLVEYRDEIAILRSDISRRANLEAGLIAGVVRLQDEVRRLESVIAASGAGNCPDLENAANQDILTDLEKWAIASAAMDAEAHQHTKRAATLNSLLERLRYTPAALSTPSEGSEQIERAITSEERLSPPAT